MTTIVPIDRFRTGKSYTIAQAARYVRSTTPTVRRWIYGDDDPRRRMSPVFGDKAPTDGQPLELSFLDLAELSVAFQFTHHGGKLEKVRRARQRLQNEFPDLPYPFASLRLKQIGGEILHVIDEEMRGTPLARAVSLGGLEGEQFVLPVFVHEALDLFEFDPIDTLATRWYPAGRDVPLVVDPRMAGGRLSVAGRGLTADTIVHRCLDTDEDWEFVAEDLEIDMRTLHAAVKYLAPKAA